MKMVFGTGEVASICGVHAKTVCKWADSGKLPSYRIPGSRHRRVTRQALMRFMRDNGVPPDGLAAFDAAGEGERP